MSVSVSYFDRRMVTLIVAALSGNVLHYRHATRSLWNASRQSVDRSRLHFGEQVCTDCPESLVPYHVKPIPEPTCVAGTKLLPSHDEYQAWDGSRCPSWCMAESPVSTAQTNSGSFKVRICSLDNAPPG